MPTVSLATDTAVLTATGDAGGEWRSRWSEPGGRLECLAASSTQQFVGTADGVCYRRPVDGGDWEVAAERGERVTAVTIGSHESETVWAGTEPSRLFVSTDGGDNWSKRPGLADLPSADRWSFPPRPDTHHVRWIAEDPHEREQLSLAIEAGAFVRSPDGGKTWQDHPEGARRDTHTIATHPDAPGRLYVAAGDGYAESADGGDTWAYPQAGLEHRYVWGLAVAPNDPDDVFVSAASGAYAAHDPDGTSYVYRRRGEGEWSVEMDGLPGPEGLGRAVLASGAETVYAATNHGLYQWDEGVWDAQAIDWPEARRDELPRGLAVG